MLLKNKIIPHRILCVFCVVFLLASTAGMAAEKTGSKAVDDSKFVSIDFNNVDINIFIKFISKLTGKNFVVDSRVKGNVTIISPTKISVKDAYKVFESVLDINGFSTVESGQVIKIVPTPQANSDNIDTRVLLQSDDLQDSEDRLVTRLVPLKYAQADELKTLFMPLVPKGSVLLSYSDTNMLIITAPLSSIDRLVKIVDVIDKQNTGKKVSVIPVQNADAEKLVKSLTTVFTEMVKGRRTAQTVQMDVKMVADERTNSIILLSSEVEAQKVRELVGILDQKVPKGDEKIRVYYLEHASAENMVKVLLEIPTTSNAKAPEGGQRTAPLLSTKVKIMADKATNSLIIMADKEDYPVLEEVIKKLDIPRAMVYIECLIMEVNVNRGLNIGTEWQVAQGASDNSRAGVTGFSADSDSAFSTLTNVAAGTLPSGFSVGVLGRTFNIGGITFRDISAVVRAFQNDKDVHILATPQILTTENEEATITVGKNVPYQTRSSADAGTETYSSYEYKDVGTTLKITPQISKDRLVRLNVYQETTRLDSATQPLSADRPTTLKRQIETTIIVEDASSVVIGGLIDESITSSETKVPCLGDIPGLGYAFKAISDGSDKTNLYVFLTPRVIKNPLEGQKLYDQKRKEIEAIQKGEVILYDQDKNEEKQTVKPQ